MSRSLITKFLKTAFVPNYYEPLLFRIGVVSALAQRSAKFPFRNLWETEFSVYSQFGEDGILNYLCDSLKISKPKVIEFGAGNFSECNTRFLAEYRHASVVAVDSRKDLVPHVMNLPVSWRTSIWPITDWITPNSADRLLNKARDLMGGVDLVSLDIDGNDYWVARDLDLDLVSIVVVEYNPLFGALMSVTVPRNDSFDRSVAHFSWLYYGASIRAWVDLFSRRGFSLVGTNRAGNNAFFVRSDRVGQIALPPVDTTDLSQFVDWRVRESRGNQGELTYLSGTHRMEVMGDLPLVDLTKGVTVSVRDAAS